MSVYTVQPGDSLSSIADKFGISLDALEAANPQISNPDVIDVGQSINIPGGSSGNTTVDEALSVQNQARQEAQNHGNHVSRPGLSWDAGLANAAQAWANHLAQTDSFEHDPNAGAGENIFSGSGFSPSFADACRAWIGEEANYHGEAIGQGNFEEWGHYTQVVWPTTTSVGIASATSASGSTYVVGRYLPQGNIVGQSAW
jgi:murein DD-endopeptidase MepM/ murein hydrolase activator NlpD